MFSMIKRLESEGENGDPDYDPTFNDQVEVQEKMLHAAGIDPNNPKERGGFLAAEIKYKERLKNPSRTQISDVYK